MSALEQAVGRPTIEVVAKATRRRFTVEYKRQARPEAVWINPPKPPAAEETRGLAATRGGVLDHARPRPVFSAHRSDLDRRGCLEAPA